VNQTEQNATELDRPLRHVTIIDPAHPLFGRTFPIVRDWSPRGRSCLVIALPGGQHRSVPRSATDLSGPDPQSLQPGALPCVSVRTILPVAQFVKRKLPATEEHTHGEWTPSTDALDLPARTSAGAGSGQPASVAVEPTGSDRSTTDSAATGTADLAHPSAAAER
jgi:hypothetical protein